MSEETNETRLQAFGAVFQQMLKFSWFKEIVESRFDVNHVIDDEDKSITTYVVEVPPSETMKRLKKLAAEAKPLIQEVEPPKLITSF